MQIQAIDMWNEGVNLGHGTRPENEIVNQDGKNSGTSHYLSKSRRLSERSGIGFWVLIVAHAVPISSNNDNTKYLRHLCRGF